MGPFPAFVPGQMVDEIQGLASGQYVIAALLASGSYTVPAGYTALIHGYSLNAYSGATSNVVTVSIAGLIAFVQIQAAYYYSWGVDRGKMYPANASNFGYIQQATGGTTQYQATNTLLNSNPNSYIVAEHAPYLFVPLASGAQITATVPAGCVLTSYFLISLHPN